MDLSAKALSLIFDTAIDTAIIALDGEGRVMAWNGGAERVLGWTAAEMAGQTLERIFLPEDQPLARIAEEMADALALGRGGHEGWRVRSDGRRIWATGEMSPVHDESCAPLAFVKVLRDRTKWKLADDALREEKRTLEALNRAGALLTRDTDLPKLVQTVTDIGVEVTGAQFGAFFCNAAGGPGDAPGIWAISGLAREAFAGFPMPAGTAAFVPAWSGENLVRSDDIASDPRFGHDFPFLGLPPGHLQVSSYLAVPVVSRMGQVIGALLFGHARPNVFTDRAERALVVLAAEAAIAIDNSRLIAEAQGEVKERRRAETALQELNSTLEAQMAQRTEELQQKEAALRQAQKMEAVGQLTGGIAHDFNNLLMGIMGSIELLQRRIAQGETRDLDRYAHAAHGAAKRAAALTHRLLAFSRRQTLDPRPVSINRLVMDMEELVRRTVGPSIDVEVATAVGVWTTRVDPNQLESALLNLCINARDAMPDGGRLTIETANKWIDERAGREREMEPGQYVSLCVTDSGVGMSPEVRQRAFDPFFTTKPIGLGTGLGLSMVYGFTRQSGGQVRLYSEPGHGTTMCIYLPRSISGDAAEAEPEHAQLLPRASRGARVLVIDDEPTVRMVARDVLLDLGYEVSEAIDGAQGLRIFNREAEHIELLITDVGLPGGMNGRQVADAARAVRADLKVLFITGYAENAVVNNGHLTPGMQVLTKPFTVEDFVQRVQGLLAKTN